MAGERSGLFYEIVRLCSDIKPRFIFLENVPAITSRGGTEVVREITKMGYDCRWCVISAASVGALHRRERWFLLAHPTSSRANRYTVRKEAKISMPGNYGKIEICNPDSEPSEQTDSGTESKQAKRGAWGRSTGQHWPFESREHWQETVSTMGKCSDGIPNHTYRLRALGNAVVPIQARKAFKILMDL